MTRWTDWEQPWSRAGGRASDYVQIDRQLVVGDIVAVRQIARPYLPAFAPWWLGLKVSRVDDHAVVCLRPEDGSPVSFTLDPARPLETHWAVKS